jgi:hypothetical protein
VTNPRVTIHGLTSLEREWLGGLFAKAGGVADNDFSIAAFASAAARGIRSHAAVSITNAGLVVEVEVTHGE